MPRRYTLTTPADSTIPTTHTAPVRDDVSHTVIVTPTTITEAKVAMLKGQPSFLQGITDAIQKFINKLKTGKLGEVERKTPGRGAYQSAMHSRRPEGTIAELEKE